MMGTLYVIGTPIGNMEDITLRQLETFRKVDFICAEDTRVTLKLLSRYDIHKPLVSYHEHSGREVADRITERILNGENAGIVTDAGMPCISDPGENLVKICYEKNIDVKVVPGASAVVSALAISGLNTSRFTFEGFLSVTKKQRFEHLESLKDEKRTMIFYEAPHKLISTLKDMLEYFGDRKISLCRELTKVYEEVLRMTISEAVEYYSLKSPKGEYVLVIEGKQNSESDNISIENALKQVGNLVDAGEKPVNACKAIAKEYGLRKSDLYSAFCKSNQEDSSDE
ncbi:MAG: 16S rRNA (cytidine(1402)-2'-O)-methyltransferase [Ruminococcus sp.]|nr:16S rRNA (cytidine(1402)-2'-O)-methyltransferase [Oscillospiraceae bacterium]MDY4414047.1 16S rRNA (cytidine(1402)-2'-O)-methyltransferase [Ruminococcus sp.]